MAQPTCDPDIATQNFVPCFAWGPAYQYNDACKWNVDYSYNGPALFKTYDCGNLDSSACENHYLSTDPPVEDTESAIYYPQCTWYNNECVSGDDLTYISDANTSNLCFIFSCSENSDCGTQSGQTCVDNKCVYKKKKN